MARQDRVQAKLQSVYLFNFRSCLAWKLDSWREWHREGKEDTWGMFTPHNVLAACHKQAWARASKDVADAYGRQVLWTISEHEQQLFDLAVANVAPAEWRPDFIGKPPPEDTFQVQMRELRRRDKDLGLLSDE